MMDRRQLKGAVWGLSAIVLLLPVLSLWHFATFEHIYDPATNRFEHPVKPFGDAQPKDNTGHNPDNTCFLSVVISSYSHLVSQNLTVSINAPAPTIDLGQECIPTHIFKDRSQILSSAPKSSPPQNA